MATSGKKTTRKKTAAKSAKAAKKTATRPVKAAKKTATKTAKAAKTAPPSRRRGSAKRSASVGRKTSETSIRVDLAVDGPARYAIDTGVAFLDHMLETFARHAHIGLIVKAKGDLQVDDHHTVEDVGLSIGEALSRALGDKAGIVRFGHFEAPLDETLMAVSVDLSGRPYLVYNVKIRHHRVGDFEVGLIEDFMRALATAAGMNLHINQRYGRNPHHILEATFKALARALSMACARDARVAGVPSTKGAL